MKEKLQIWKNENYNFNLDWLVRSVNTILTGEAKFQHLHDKTSDEISDALKKATRHIDTSLNLIPVKLGLDHDQVLFGRFALPVMVRYLDKTNGGLNERDRDKLLFWYVQAGMWGRFSTYTESTIDNGFRWTRNYGKLRITLIFFSPDKLYLQKKPTEE